ncbi:MAG TPA: SDR family NAD(P)-dependent oxidoreductase [Blastocatellia bacterium]|nr:SDR family NAD(P)-dependent oxidoreductase [Blastocatellia bacterium]
MGNRINNQLLLGALGVGAFFAARHLIRQANAYSFRGRVVLITGGSRGLGLLLARELAGEGARLAICARDEDELQRAQEELGALTEIIAIPCDVSDRRQVETFVQAAQNHFGQIDVLVNNAGTIAVGPMDVMTVEDYEQAMRVHFWGPLYAVLAVLPEMKRRGTGRIVNVSSIGGKLSVPHLLPYSASKFALVGLSEGLRAELRKDGILVTTVCPGLMRTGSPRNASFKGQHEAEYAWFKISDSLPLTSINARRAARQIIDAARHGDSEVVLTVQAKAAALFHGVFPGLTADLLGLVNQLLPEAGGIGTRRVKGRKSESELSRSWLAALTDRAAEENNQIH